MSAVCSTWCISKLNVSFYNNEVRQMSGSLLSSLCARKQEDMSDDDNQWLEYNYLCHLLPLTTNRYVYQMVINCVLHDKRRHVC